MDKQMIEEKKEIAKELDKVYPNAKFTNGWIAEVLYKLGYRKIPENAVVLTEEEKRKFLHGMYEQGKFDGVVKFAERLKQVGELHYHFGEQRYDIATDDIDEICKEITEAKV